MASLTAKEKAALEKLFDLSSGYVLNFSDASMGSFFGDFNIDIHSDKYKIGGPSKAKKLREFWRVEPDAIVGEVTLAMIEHFLSYRPEDSPTLVSEAQDAAKRLLNAKVNLESLKIAATKFDLNQLHRQIRRIESSIDSDPELAIGTSKELLETCCKTILHERNIEFDERNDDLLKLLKLTQGELGLLTSSLNSEATEYDIVKRILGNLGQIGQGITELRNKFGTGHGKVGKTISLLPRHARLAATASSALATFLFETHLALKK